QRVHHVHGRQRARLERARELGDAGPDRIDGAHRSSWGAPRWPPTPPIARTRPGAAVARLGLSTGCLIDRRGGPRYGPPDPSSERGYAPLGLPRPSLGRAPAQPWRASGLTQDVSSIVGGGSDMAPQPLQANGATPPSDSPGQRSDAHRPSRGAPPARHRMSHLLTPLRALSRPAVP